MGIDLSEKSIRYAIDNVPEGKFQVLNISDMTFPDNHFDGVMEAGVLFHFSESEQISILRKIERMITKEGLFLSMYPEGDYEGLEELNKDGEVYKRYARKIPISKWIKTVEGCGFSIKKKLEFNIGTFKAFLFSKGS